MSRLGPRQGQRAFALVLALLLLELQEREIGRGIVYAQPHLAAGIGAEQLFGEVTVVQRVEVERAHRVAVRAVVRIAGHHLRQQPLELLRARHVDEELLLFSADVPHVSSRAATPFPND